MEKFNRKKHWESLYENKKLDEVSWYEPTPSTSLHFFEDLNIPKSAKIIDVGGGDSFLVDHILEKGYREITIVDISEAALGRAKKRLGEKAAQVNWICADAANFTPTEQYDCWHDRAAFHFLTEEKEIESYLNTVSNFIKASGNLIIGTFSEQGPTKCSGIEIKQYSESTLAKRFEKKFEKITCFYVDHKTPFETVQNFVFCSFRKK